MRKFHLVKILISCYFHVHKSNFFFGITKNIRDCSVKIRLPAKKTPFRAGPIPEVEFSPIKYFTVFNSIGEILSDRP